MYTRVHGCDNDGKINRKKNKIRDEQETDSSDEEKSDVDDLLKLIMPATRRLVFVFVLFEW